MKQVKDRPWWEPPCRGSWDVQALASHGPLLGGLVNVSIFRSVPGRRAEANFLKLSLINLPGIFCIVFDLI